MWGMGDCKYISVPVGEEGRRGRGNPDSGRTQITDGPGRGGGLDPRTDGEMKRLSEYDPRCRRSVPWTADYDRPTRVRRHRVRTGRTRHASVTEGRGTEGEGEGEKKSSSDENH